MGAGAAWGAVARWCDAPRTQGRSGVLLGFLRSQAATALQRSYGVSLKQDLDLDQTPKASATKAAGYFLLSKATKVRLDSLRSKVTKEVASF
ncbi:hypothetical protein GLA29479_1438 [Lysobacter antibioticus]|nr:hypothetical protein GLA29479_1438 [Lysobacter antibioticus]